MKSGHSVVGGRARGGDMALLHTEIARTTASMEAASGRQRTRAQTLPTHPNWFVRTFVRKLPFDILRGKRTRCLILFYA